MATVPTQEDLNRLHDICAGPTPAETVAGHFHRAMRTPRDAEGWRKLAELAEEAADLARHMEQAMR